ncbi:MAG: hypothetical protein LBV00_13205, partial [Propionibacteriaceae bacterium]|nr:hypothetical protein [Propionibacteriaceae bacterium]
MAWLGLDFTSAAERAKRQRAYQAKLLPLGPDQRLAALTVLTAVTKSHRRDEELLFAFFHAKQAYQDAIDAQDDLSPQQAALSALSDLTWLSEADCRA